MLSKYSSKAIDLFLNFEQKHKHVICYAYALLASVFFTTTSFLVKILPHLTSSEILFYRQIQLFLLTMWFMDSLKMEYHFKDTTINRMLISRGFLGFFAMALNYYGLYYLPLSEANVIQQTSPAMVGILAAMFLKEKYEMSQFWGALICMGGVVLIAQPEFLFAAEASRSVSGNAKLFGVLILLASTILISVNQILVKTLGTQTNEGIITLIFAAISAFFCPILSIVQGFNPITARDVIVLLFLGITSFLGQMFRNRAYVLGNAGKIALMAYFGIIYSIFLDVFVLGNHLDFYSILGVVAIFSSLFVMLYKIIKKQKSTKK